MFTVTHQFIDSWGEEEREFPSLDQARAWAISNDGLLHWYTIEDESGEVYDEGY